MFARWNISCKHGSFIRWLHVPFVLDFSKLVSSSWHHSKNNTMHMKNIPRLVSLFLFIVAANAQMFVASCQSCNYSNCIPSPKNEFLCYEANTTYPVFMQDNNMWYMMQEYDFCFKMKEPILFKKTKLCARSTLFDLYCEYNTTCVYNATMCSNGVPYSREYRCPIWYKNYHIIGPAILLPLLGFYILVTLALLCIRRRYFPIVVKSIPAFVTQFIAGFFILFFISMIRVVPCGLTYFGVFLSSPLYVAFITTRVWQYSITYLHVVDEQFCIQVQGCRVARVLVTQ